MIYFVYMLRCEDNSIYTGITTEIRRRIKEHYFKDKNCAKYTRTHHVKSVEIVWQTDNRVTASQLEYHIKRLKKAQKEELILHPDKLGAYINSAFNCIPLTITLEDCLE